MGQVRPLYLEDSYLKEFTAKIEETKDGRYLILDNTAFYPESGGQPADTGTMAKDGKEYKVTSVRKMDGKICHDVEPGLAAGDTVHCRIDWARRYRLMQMHTATHILAAVLYKDAGALITGNQLNLDRTRIDFSMDEFDKEKILGYVEKANAIAAKGIEVKISFLPREEAMKIEGAVKLAAALPPNISELRMLEIPGVDLQADGGTHVRNTSEVGKIRFLEAENKGKKNRRIYFTLE